MFTKILFIDDDGDMMMDFAHAAYITSNHAGTTGIRIDLTDDIGIFVPYADDSLIRQLFENDKLDITSKGRVVWIDEDGNWSDAPDEEDKEEEE